MKHGSYLILWILMAIQPVLTGQCLDSEFGIFKAFDDVGLPGIQGSFNFDGATQEYRISGSGENIWFAEDHFSFLYKEMEGDFILQASVKFFGTGVNPHRKTGIMVRSGMSTDAAHVSCVVHGDGLTALQFRNMAGKEMEEVQFEVRGPDVIQLEKKGDRYTMSVAHFGEPYKSRSLVLPLGGEIRAGIFICSHNDTVLEEAVFTNVKAFGTAPDDLVPYREYIGSMLEVMEVGSGRRFVLDCAKGSWQAPNWTPDGKSLIYNANGLLYKYDLAEGDHTVLPTGFATRNNNDHVISFDGEQIAISHHASEDEGESVIYKVPIEGGDPVRVTPESPSYLHGWSADDQFLVYTGRRNGSYDIYKIPVTGGGEVRLTDFATLDDGPEFSPDGKYIYFNSCRTGTMQIWRMDPDGGNQTQLTFDEYNDWFPHISPDNRWIVFISYSNEVPADSHPFYKRVYLRLMSVEDMKPRVIGYVYGGQGTMNVPSWSPDSKKIAFVSNGIFH